MNALPQAERDALRQAILAKHPTVYAFWKAHQHKISKSVVFLVLLGTYPGHQARQAERMRVLLRGAVQGASPHAPSEDEIVSALERVACARCPRQNRRNRHRCKACLALWRAQALEIGRIAGGTP